MNRHNDFSVRDTTFLVTDVLTQCRKNATIRKSQSDKVSKDEEIQF